MRPLAAIYAVAASILVVGLVLQVFLAGLGVFDDPTFFLTHRDTGYTLELAALIFGLFLLQSVFVAVRVSSPAVAALHPVNGFLILLLAIVLARRAWAFARGSNAAAAVPGPQAADVAELDA